MKEKITREDVSKQLVTDSYFEPGNVGLKIKQTILVIIAWLLIFIPFIWLAIPFFFPRTADWLDFRVYVEERSAFSYLFIFLIVVFLLLTVLFVLLTRKNNRRFKNQLHKQSLHDEEMLEKRKMLMSEFYTARFGEQEERQKVRYYVVKPEQNISETEIKSLFQRNEV
ncbi:hypothetical protein [Enterococcus sp. DIV0876]|uniref:hypothetical protein n=1 Tax=Enterococcus sp. DIV0876 TaxID=2774633 RepID=UPI003D300BFC